jgi:DNA-binding transcriptional LysR family regulator
MHDMHIRMDWRSMAFDWNRARAFLVTAQEGSLSAAARALGMAQPTLGRQVSALEHELGVVLFERVGRGLHLTPDGLALLDHVRAMGDAASQVSLTAIGRTARIEGKVIISASEIYAVHLLPPILAKLRATAPGIELEIVSSNTPSDLRRREADIALRNFRPTDPDLIARKLRDVPARLYASPTYLDRIGHPTRDADLSRADFISIDGTGMFRDALIADGLALSDRNFPILTESYLVMWELVKTGLGIGILDGVIGDAEPRVRRVLPDRAPLVFPLWLVAHRELRTSQRVRLVYDLLARDLSTHGPG